jgi:hypothetical protein
VCLLVRIVRIGWKQHFLEVPVERLGRPEGVAEMEILEQLGTKVSAKLIRVLSSKTYQWDEMRRAIRRTALE